MNKKVILLRILFVINIVFLLLLLASNLTGKVDPSAWWPVSLTGLLFIVLLIIALLTGVFWLFVKPGYAIFCFAAILLSIPNLIITFPLNLSSGLEYIRDPTQLRVVSWNVNLMNYSAKDDETAIRQNEKIFTALRDLNADVICLQDFFTAVIDDKKYNFIDSFKNHMGFRHHFYSRDKPKFEGKFYSGTIIFSKYPIIDSSRIPFPDPIAGSSIRAGILYHNDTIDIISTHLQNVNFGRDEDKALGASVPTKSGFVSRLQYGYADQVKQVKTIQRIIDVSTRPLIFTGDLNDVPTSYTYRKIKGGLNDAWLKKGSGIGSTYKVFAHILRIDHIFYNNRFNATAIERIKTDASDHYGIVADLQLLK